MGLGIIPFLTPNAMPWAWSENDLADNGANHDGAVDQRKRLPLGEALRRHQPLGNLPSLENQPPLFHPVPLEPYRVRHELLQLRIRPALANHPLGNAEQLGHPLIDLRQALVRG